MATNAAAIEASIIAQLQANCDMDLDNEHSHVRCLINAIAEGLYPELQNLEDTAGGPASPDHQ